MTKPPNSGLILSVNQSALHENKILLAQVHARTSEAMGSCQGASLFCSGLFGGASGAHAWYYKVHLQGLPVRPMAFFYVMRITAWGFIGSVVGSNFCALRNVKNYMRNQGSNVTTNVEGSIGSEFYNSPQPQQQAESPSSSSSFDSSTWNQGMSSQSPTTENIDPWTGEMKK